MSDVSDKTIEVAEFLRDLGWRSHSDAQWTNLDGAIGRLRALLHPAPAIPEGWRLVPVEATYEMVTAGIRSLRTAPVVGVYEAMIEAAPTPPGSGESEPEIPVEVIMSNPGIAADYMKSTPQPAAAPQAAEPVAWRYRYDDAWRYTETPQRELEREHGFPPAQALYATPPPPGSTDADARDAARYRYLRRPEAWKENYIHRRGGISPIFVSNGSVGVATDTEQLDAAIDAAMQQEGRSDG